MKTNTAAANFAWDDVLVELGKNRSEPVKGQSAEDDMVNVLKKQWLALLQDDEDSDNNKVSERHYEKECATTKSQNADKHMRRKQAVLSWPTGHHCMMYMSVMGTEFRNLMSIFKLETFKNLASESGGVS